MDARTLHDQLTETGKSNNSQTDFDFGWGFLVAEGLTLTFIT